MSAPIQVAPIQAWANNFFKVLNWQRKLFESFEKLVIFQMGFANDCQSVHLAVGRTVVDKPCELVSLISRFKIQNVIPKLLASELIVGCLLINEVTKVVKDTRFKR